MPFNSFRKDPKSSVNIVILSAACCMPGMAPLDEQARRMIEQALSETGIEAQIQIVPATNAFLGAVPRQVMVELINRAQSGQMPAPAVLINGKAVSYGMPELENFKSTLLAAIATDRKIPEQEKPNDSSHLDESPA